MADAHIDWRTPQVPEDMLSALDSLYSYDDFSGRAVITSDVSDDTPFSVDLVVQNVSFSLEEHIQQTPHVGDTFGIVCFGKAPLTVRITGTLIDQDKNYNKQYLVDLWKNKLRLGAVARSGKVPTFRFTTHVFVGPFVSMQLTESTDMDGVVGVVLEMLVTMVMVRNDDDSVVFDYIHSVEVSDNTALLAGAVVEKEIEQNGDKAVSQQTPDEQVNVQPSPAAQSKSVSSTPKLTPQQQKELWKPADPRNAVLNGNSSNDDIVDIMDAAENGDD